LSYDAENTKFAPIDWQKLSKLIPGLFNDFSGFESAIFAGRRSQGA
jgi:hypothetical protein